VATFTRGCEAALYSRRSTVHDLVGGLMKRDAFISLIALAAGVGAALLVAASDREPSPAAASQLGIGVAILTNSQDHQLQNELALSILADVVGERGVYQDRLLALPWRPPAADPNNLLRATGRDDEPRRQHRHGRDGS
jgi:hypothetical protein